MPPSPPTAENAAYAPATRLVAAPTMTASAVNPIQATCPCFGAVPAPRRYSQIEEYGMAIATIPVTQP